MQNNKNLWQIFTHSEEYNPFLRDKFERTPYYLSQNRNVFYPIVSEYLSQNGFIPTYPNGKKFAVVLSHDMDMLFYRYPTPFRFAKDVIKRFNIDFRGLFKGLYQNITKKIPHDLHIERTFEIENEYNAVSSFYFLASEHNDVEFNYNLADIKHLFPLIKKNGGEIGLHGGLKAFKDSMRLKNELKKLVTYYGDDIYGYRNHVLKFRMPETFRFLEDCGFKYDTTLGYPDAAGFRNGMCYPYQPFDLEHGRFINLLEIPLTIMDVQLFDNMRLNFEQALKISKYLIDITEKFNGVISILWHNNFMVGEMGRFYKELLNYAYSKNAWLTSGEQMYFWWTENKYYKLCNDALMELKLKSDE